MEVVIMVLTEDDMFNISFDVVRDQNSKEHPAHSVCNKAFQAILKTVNRDEEIIIDTVEIYEDIIDCFDYYNDFVTEKKIPVPLIDESYYLILADAINMGVEMIKNGE